MRLAAVAVALLALLASPIAAALPGSPYDVSIRTTTASAPIVLLAGAVNFTGHAHGGIFATDVVRTTWRDVARVVINDQSGGTSKRETYAEVDVEITTGGFLWLADDTEARLSATYGFAFSTKLPAFSMRPDGSRTRRRS
ncbi:MAG: hypothetical protein ACYDCK_06785 [Thermoplasmatota archaeon]